MRKGSRRANRMKLAMLRFAAHLTRVLAGLLATAYAAHAGEATEAASATPDQFKLMIGSVLMSDYIYRGISYSAHQPAVGTYVDAQQGFPCRTLPTGTPA